MCFCFKIAPMKRLKFFIILIILTGEFASRSFAQNILPEVKIVASTYKYLNEARNREMGQPVRMLEYYAASYDLKKSEFYDGNPDGYYISFSVADAEILAMYDKDGKLLRTSEKFTNTKMPVMIKDEMGLTAPGWHVVRDEYKFNYNDRNGAADKTFELLLKKGCKRMKVKFTANWDFI